MNFLLIYNHAYKTGSSGQLMKFYRTKKFCKYCGSYQKRQKTLDFFSAFTVDFGKTLSNYLRPADCNY